MREFTTLKFCDLCWEESETKVPGITTFTIGVTEGETQPALRLLECCEAHVETFQFLRGLMNRLGKFDRYNTSAPPAFAMAAATGPGSRGPRGPNQGTTPVEPCPVCGSVMTRSGIVMHMWNLHLIPLGVEKPPAPTSCPDCDFEGSATAVGVHRVTKHKYNVINHTYQVYLDARAGKHPKATVALNGIDQLALTDGDAGDVEDGGVLELEGPSVKAEGEVAGGKPKRSHRKQQPALT
jgi:hypothetical protein